MADYWVRLKKNINVRAECERIRSYNYTFKNGFVVSRGLTLDLTEAQAEAIKLFDSVAAVQKVPDDYENQLFIAGQFFKQNTYDSAYVNPFSDPVDPGPYTDPDYTIPIGNPDTDDPQMMSKTANWALLDCTDVSSQDWGIPPSVANIAEETAPTWWKAGDYELYSQGEHVDIVIIDTGLPKGHPEFGDRFVEFNWHSLTPYCAANNLVSGPLLLTEDFSYSTIAQYNATFDKRYGHGLHVATTAAGTHNGWAKQANVYSMPFFLGVNGPEGMSEFQTDEQVFGYVRAFHRTKPINPVTGKRNPTIVNNSWGGGQFTPYFDQLTSLKIDNVVYGPDNPIDFNDAWDSYGATAKSSLDWGFKRVNIRNEARIGLQQDVAEDGIIMVCASGNDNTYLASTDDPRFDDAWDGDNFFTRPQWGESINVGALGNKHGRFKASFSNFGSGIDVWAPGEEITASWLEDENTSWLHFGVEGLTKDFKYAEDVYLNSISGTSMASPQVCGIIACAAGADKDYRYSLSKARHYLDVTSQADGINSYEQYLVWDDQWGAVAGDPPNRLTSIGNPLGDQRYLLSRPQADDATIRFAPNGNHDANGNSQGLVGRPLVFMSYSNVTIRYDGCDDRLDWINTNWNVDYYVEDQDGNAIDPSVVSIRSPILSEDGTQVIFDGQIIKTGTTNSEIFGVTSFFIKDRNNPSLNQEVRIIPTEEKHYNYGAMHAYLLDSNDFSKNRTVFCSPVRPTSGVITTQKRQRTTGQTYPRPSYTTYTNS